MCSTCNHVNNMSTMLQIRNVPDKLHRTLKARAALAGMSMSDFALRILRVALERPTREELLARLAAVAGVTPETLLAEWHRQILAARPKSMMLTRISGWIAFLWAAAFAVAATRSSRWRRD